MKNCLTYGKIFPAINMRLKSDKGSKLFYLLFLFSLFFIASDVWAQTVVTGKVTSGDSVIVGATVQVKNSGQATTTDANGKYSITAPINSTLVFSSVGYPTVEEKVNSRNLINVQLTAISQQLSDVVVVGYGTQRKATLTGAITAIKGEELLKSPATNVANSLVGRTPGLMSVSTSGEPGRDAPVLRIRGVNTFSARPNNDPSNDPNNALVVVDGVPGRSLDRIDPYSIESITVLKDASAAIYGSRAANGVILVTTKRAKTGKPTVDVNLNYGITRPTVIPKMADAPTYAMMINEINEYAGRPKVYSDEDIAKFQNGSDPYRFPNTNWFKETLRSWAPQKGAHAAVSGGSESFRYFISLGARSQEGNFRHNATEYNQYDFRTNFDSKINKYINLGFDVAGRMENRNYATTSGAGIFGSTMQAKPILIAQWPEGKPALVPGGLNPAIGASNEPGYDKDNTYVLNSNIKLNVKIPWVVGLSVTGNANIDKTFGFRKLWETPYNLYIWDGQTMDANGQPVVKPTNAGIGDPRLTEYARDERLTVLNVLINYETSFGRHNLKLLAGTEKIKGQGYNFSAFRRNFLTSALDELFAGGTTDLNNTGSAFINSRVNYFGRVNYNFREKYLGEFVWRYDGSYIFNPNDKPYGFFPGVSLGWRVSEEDFWKEHVSVINNFKLRGSWGRTGNDRIGEWNYLTTYSVGNFFSSPYTPMIVNGVEYPTLYEPRIPNPSATWEIANQFDVGFDASAFNNKLTIEADYFVYKRSGILINRSVSIPTSTGMSLPAENLGKSQNKGFDFNVSYKNSIGELKYQVSVNGGYSKSKVLFWDEAPGLLEYQKRTGHPIPTNPDPNANLYYVAGGIFKNQDEVDKTPHWLGARPGDVIFNDVNNDGKIDGNDRVRNYKTNIPTFTGGLSLGLQFRQFDLMALFQGAAGAVSYVATFSGEIGNYLESFAENRWTAGNPDATYPRTFNRENEYWMANPNTFWLRKTDYIRLKNAQLGYTLPRNLSNRLNIQNLRVFVSGLNLWTYSPDYKDFDPEVAAYYSQSYPSMKVVNFGLNLTF